MSVLEMVPIEHRRIVEKWVARVGRPVAARTLGSFAAWVIARADPRQATGTLHGLTYPQVLELAHRLEETDSPLTSN